MVMGGAAWVMMGGHYSSRGIIDIFHCLHYVHYIHYYCEFIMCLLSVRRTFL